MNVMNLNNKSSVFMWLNYVATILFAMWAISPYLLRNASNLAVFFIVALWLCSALFEIILKRKAIKIKNFGIIICIVYWQIWEYMLRAMDYSTASWGNYYSNTLFWFSIIIYLFQSNYATEKAKKIIAAFIFLIYTVNLIDNLRLLSLYPTASTDINFSWGEQYLKMNIGGTMFNTLTMLVFCISIAIVLKHTDKKVKIIFGMLCIIEILYIYICARATVIILIIAALLLNILSLFPIYQKQKPMVILMILLGLPLMAYYVVPSILEQVILISKNDRVVERMVDLVSLLRGQLYASRVESSSLLQRISLARISLSTFFSSVKNFFIGVGYHTYKGYYESLQTGVGGHSEFIDLLAKYGLVGACFVFSILRQFFKLSINNMKGEPFYSNIKVVVTIYILCSFFNTSFSPEIGIIMFILMPYSRYLFVSIKEQKESKMSTFCTVEDHLVNNGKII